MTSLVDRDFLVGRLTSLCEPAIAAHNAVKRPDTRSLADISGADIPVLRTSAAARQSGFSHQNGGASLAMLTEFRALQP